MVIARTAVVFAALAAWQLAAVSKIATPGTLPTPIAVTRVLWNLIGTPGYWRSVWETFSTWGLGLLIATAIAVPVGSFLGANALAYRSSRATVDFVRTLPPVALIPVVSLLYGARLKTALVLVVFATLWPLLVQSMYGMRQVDPVARDTARTYQLGRWRTLWAVSLPSALPYLGTGIRIASTMSLLLAVGVEFIAGAPGLGASIAVAQATYLTTQMYAYIVTTALVGVLLTSVIIAAESRILSWHPSHRKAT